MKCTASRQVGLRPSHPSHLVSCRACGVRSAVGAAGRLCLLLHGMEHWVAKQAWESRGEQCKPSHRQPNRAALKATGAQTSWQPAIMQAEPDRLCPLPSPRGLEHAMPFATLCEGALHGAGSSVLHLCHAGHAPAPHVLCSATMLHSQSCRENPGRWECKE